MPALKEIFPYLRCKTFGYEIEISDEIYGKQKFSINKLFKASRDGWTAKDFHSKCDGKGPTLSLFW
jgi:hypothetical protein